MREITNELEIRAPLARVWELTLDVEGWPATTPTITDVQRIDSGPMAVGSQARVKQPMQRATTWTVTRLVPERLFEWRAKVGTVTMTARHELTPVVGDGTAGVATRNRLTVALSGPGHRVAHLLIGRSIAKAIATENQGFKAAAEGTLAPT